MNKTDDLIKQTLSAEDRDLLARHGEPGYFSQAFGLFRGTLGWVVWVAYLCGIAAFAGFGVSLWRSWHATEVLAAVQWGVHAITCLVLRATKTQSFQKSNAMSVL